MFIIPQMTVLLSGNVKALISECDCEQITLLYIKIFQPGTSCGVKLNQFTDFTIADHILYLQFPLWMISRDSGIKLTNLITILQSQSWLHSDGIWHVLFKEINVELSEC